MIDEIEVHDLALIRNGSLEPSRGLTVLTGETGAGKTALLSALKLLMGARASADLVRDGERELQVSGRFYGLPSASDEPKQPSQEAGETIVVRTVNTDGRSRARIDGTMASVHELTSLVAPSIDLCGQFEHQQLMKAATHGAMLDAWAAEQIHEARVAYEQAFREAQGAQERYAQIQEAQQLSSAKLDEARFILNRIDEVAPEEGEYEQLKHDLSIAENGEALMQALTGARSSLADDEGAMDKLASALGDLENAASMDAALDPAVQLLREASFFMEDAAVQLRQYGDGLDFDPEQLAFQQDRFASLQGLLRAYGPRMEDVLAKREEAASIVAAVDDGDASLRRAQEEVDRAEEALLAAARILDDLRAQAAPDLVAQVSDVMGALQMGEAQVSFAFEPLPRERWGLSGPSSFEFLYQPVADGRARPLGRIASGGEMSRVMLALKVVLGAADEVDTLVFDEVDAGVGGAVAVSLGRVLADLAKTHQVIVVTHLAQVAVHADAHYVVSRDGDETSIVPVQGDEREQEIARMLGGSITEASLAHARELLQSRE